MKRNPISRRTLLKSASAVLALPSLEVMASDASKGDAAVPPPRFAFFYVPFGVNTTTWFPVATGAEHDFSPALEPLRQFKSDLTILGGLHHHRPGITGHLTMDSHLTGTNPTRGFNTQSFDQLLADRIGKKSYLKSMVLSTAGGTGSPGESKTLSFNKAGAPLAADKSPRAVFNKLFPPADQADRDALRKRLLRRTSILDALRDETRAFMRPLGQPDRDKMNEYLTSVREVEHTIQIREEQLRRGPPAGDAAALALQASPSNNMEERRAYIRCMFDLIYLGFVADTTRVASYALTDEKQGGFTDWSDLCGRGGPTDWHQIVHRHAEPEMSATRQTQIDRWLVEQFAYLVGRLKSTSEGEGTLLDRCMLLYGSGNSRTHLHRNLPLVLAGGNAFHLKHGQYLTYVVKNRLEAAVVVSEEVKKSSYALLEEGSAPFANLFVTMARQAGIDIPGFADSTGVITDLLA
ncbi:hypothetical protein ETAA8_16220 [Anatilimnocola aggregata]|uniref:DUF1552 domain-containing protein n=1 Tax=Anatilimnocola aggregata TaxID=2528021 RepID=A0A517Y8S6_9BACT|nr:DUF1552 domain-containing protein [Anatilimnocola aggregata]QDU26542.1 hypothetical protein ETAA8_16220 [Anatilimnocola aggregata]